MINNDEQNDIQLFEKKQLTDAVGFFSLDDIFVNIFILAKLVFNCAALEGVGKASLHTGHLNDRSMQPSQKVCPHGSTFGIKLGLPASSFSRHIRHSKTL